MIKPSELRLKNYVSTSTGNLYRIDAITETEVRARMVPSGPMPIILMASSLRGIPLTSDWLLMFGFKLVGSQTYEKTCGDDFTIKVEDDQHCGTALFLEGSGAIPIDSVHQLQNIVHSITGEELTIQE